MSNTGYLLELASLLSKLEDQFGASLHDHSQIDVRSFYESKACYQLSSSRLRLTKQDPLSVVLPSSSSNRRSRLEWMTARVLSTVIGHNKTSNTVWLSLSFDAYDRRLLSLNRVQPNSALPTTIATGIATGRVDSIVFEIPNSYPRQSPSIFCCFRWVFTFFCVGRQDRRTFDCNCLDHIPLFIPDLVRLIQIHAVCTLLLLAQISMMLLKLSHIPTFENWAVARVAPLTVVQATPLAITDFVNALL